MILWLKLLEIRILKNIEPSKKNSYSEKKNNKYKLYAKRRKAFLRVLYSLFIGLIFSLAILTLSNFTKINALYIEIRQVDATIKQVEKTNMDLVAEMEKLKSDKDIVREARTKLGMIYP